MIRPFTLLCFCAFAGIGAWLYQVKHQVAMKDRELVEIRRQTEQARQRLDILRAEWALLNEPGRLRQNATRVLSLEPMQPQHFARPADIERRLPAAQTGCWRGRGARRVPRAPQAVAARKWRAPGRAARSGAAPAGPCAAGAAACPARPGARRRTARAAPPQSWA
jgi:hypothetical protein